MTTQYYSANEFHFVMIGALVARGGHYAITAEIARAMLWLVQHGVDLNSVLPRYLDNPELYNDSLSTAHLALRCADFLRAKGTEQSYASIDDPLLFIALLAVNNCSHIYLRQVDVFLENQQIFCWEALEKKHSRIIDAIPVVEDNLRAKMINTPRLPDHKQAIQLNGIALDTALWQQMWTTFSQILAPETAQSGTQAG